MDFLTTSLLREGERRYAMPPYLGIGYPAITVISQLRYCHKRKK